MAEACYLEQAVQKMRKAIETKHGRRLKRGSMQRQKRREKSWSI